jgi:GAF domain-containing protein
MMNILKAQMSGVADEDRVELVNTVDQQMMNILEAQMRGVAEKDRTELVSTIDQHAPASVASTFHSMSTNRKELAEEQANDDEDDKSQKKNILQFRNGSWMTKT